MTQSTIDQVRTFMETFKRPIRDVPDLTNAQDNQLCFNLIQEELFELKDAMSANDPKEALDALTDLQYVIDFAYLFLGFHKVKDEAFAEVQRSNMSKLGEDGQPILRESDNKIMKGPNYTKPDIQQFIDKLAA